MKFTRGMSVIIVILGSACNLSCDRILEPEIKGQIELNKLFTSQEGVIMALNGAYEPLRSIYGRHRTLWVSLIKASDNGWTWQNETSEQRYNLTPNSPEITTWWNAHYTGINRCNTALSRISGTEAIDEELKSEITGQLKFLRALYYFNLVRLYGGIPLLVNEVITREDAEQPRAAIEAVYDQIKADLTDAISVLPSSYSGHDVLKTGMATKGAATALLATVYLELNEWDQAAALSEELIHSNVYDLHDDYAANFYGNAENGIESIFEVQFSDVSSQYGANHSTLLAPQDFKGQAHILPGDDNNDFGTATTGSGIVQAFPTGDARKETAISTYGLPNFLNPDKPAGSLYFINKYFDHNDFPPSQSPFNFPLIRYSEILLTAAEALNELGPGSATAVDYVNRVRNRAGLPDLELAVANDQDQFRETIVQERRVELAFEAKRYFDLNRLGMLREIIALTGISISPEKLVDHPVTNRPYHLFPLPATEFINNAKLGEQNPGY